MAIRLYGGGPALVANTATIIGESLRSPRTDSVVELETGEVVISTPSRPDMMGLGSSRNRTKKEALSATYKMVLIYVGALTLLSFVVEIALAIWGKDPPTGFQNTLFLGADFGWKAGFGAIVGLLGGKQT
jgi:hypothetical protein